MYSRTKGGFRLQNHIYFDYWKQNGDVSPENTTCSTDCKHSTSNMVFFRYKIVNALHKGNNKDNNNNNSVDVFKLYTVVWEVIKGKYRKKTMYGTIQILHAVIYNKNYQQYGDVGTKWMKRKRRKGKTTNRIIIIEFKKAFTILSSTSKGKVSPLQAYVAQRGPGG